MTGILDLGGNKITSVGTPTAASDAATKAYVDATAGGDITEVTAGTGLSGGGTTGAVTLEVAYDDLTIGLTGTSSLEVKDGGITSIKIADGTIVGGDLNSTININTTGIVTAAAFYGDGSNLTGITTTGADFGRSGVATALYEGTTTLEAKYVNQAGDTMTGDLRIEGDLTVTGTIDSSSPVKVVGGLNVQTGTLEVASGETKLNNVTYSWPGSDGSNGDALTTDGSGILSWTSSGAGDITAVDATGGLSGGGESGRVTLEVASGGITASMLATGSVTSGAIANNTITGDDLTGDINITTTGSISATSVVGTHYGDGSNLTGILTTANDFGRSGVSTTLYEGTTSLEAKYVELAGDTMTGDLIIDADLTVTGTIDGGSPVKVVGGLNVQTGTLEVASDTRFNTVTYTWPSTQGIMDQVLANDGSGQLSWSTVESSASGWTDDGTDVRLTTITDNVGIGTNEPTGVLQVTRNQDSFTDIVFTNKDAGASAGVRMLLQNDVSQGGVGAISSNFPSSTMANRILLLSENSMDGLRLIAQDPSGDIVFDTGGALTDRMIIDSSGRVGIGTMEPAALLSVAGTIETTAGGVKFPDGTTQLTAATSGGDITALDAGDGLSGGGETGRVTLEVADGGITAYMLAAGSVTSGAIANNTITGDDLAGDINITTTGSISATSLVGTHYGDGSNLSGVPMTPAGSDGQVQYNNSGILGGATNLYYDDATGLVGVGTSDAEANLTVQGTFEVRDLSHISLFTISQSGKISLGDTSSTSYYDDNIWRLGSAPLASSPIFTTRTAWGNFDSSYTLSSISANRLYGAVVAQPSVSDTTPGSNSGLAGLMASPRSNAAGGTFPLLSGVYFKGRVVNASGTVTDVAALIMEDAEATGTITNQYGVKIPSLEAGTNNYGIYVQNASTYPIWVDDGTSRFDGNVMVGTITPSSMLTVGGTIETTAGGVKFPDGTTQLTAASGGGDITAVDATDGLSGGGESGRVTLEVADGGITSIKIQDGTIAGQDLAGAINILTSGLIFRQTNEADAAFIGVSNQSTDANAGALVLAQNASGVNAVMGVLSPTAANFANFVVVSAGTDTDTSVEALAFNIERQGAVNKPIYFVQNAEAGEPPRMMIGTNGNVAVRPTSLSYVPASSLEVVGTFGVSGTTTFNNVAYTWPAADGSADYVLKTNGSGILTWESGSGTGDITSVTAGTGLSGGGTTGDVTLEVADGGITASMLATGSVTSGAIANNTITGDDLAGDINITTSGSIAAGSLVGTHYGDGSNLSSVPMTPAGSDGQVQYNDGGALGGASDLSYSDTTGFVGIGIGSTAATAQLTVANSLEVTGASATLNVGNYFALASGISYLGTSLTYNNTGYQLHISERSGSGTPIFGVYTTSFANFYSSYYLNNLGSDGTMHGSYLSEPASYDTTPGNTSLVSYMAAPKYYAASGTLPLMAGVYFRGVATPGASSVTDVAALIMEDALVNVTATITNQYGVKIPNLTAATNDYGIYVAGADTYPIWIDSGTSRFDGNVMIGTITPSSMLTVAGTIETTAGGYKFPDGTTQLTAATGGSGDITAVDAGDGLSGGGESGRVTLEVASGGITAAMLATGSVTSGAIADGTITGDDLAGDINIITTGSISATSVVGTHYGDGSNLTDVPVSAAGSNGFVQFNDAGALGANADLFWHISNKRLGVGTTEPERFIHVKSDPADDTAYVRIEGTGNAAGNEAGLELFAGPNAPASVFYYRGSAYKGKTFVDTDDRFKIDVAGQNRLVIDTSGNVGIGTPEPQSILNIVQNQDSPTFAILSNTNTAATSLAMYRLINAQSAGGIGITSSNFPISTYANRVIVGAESGMSGVLIAAEDSAGNIILNTGGQADSYERMRITSVGRVGIGSSEPGSILTVAGTVETTAGGYKFPDGTIQTTAATGGTGDITAVDAGDGLSGGGESGRVTLEVADGGITAAMLGSGVVTSGAIANNTITGDDLANNINITTTGSIAATTFAGGVFYGDGSNLANVPGNTLGGAYNEGGSGEGRVIQTYSEAVVIQYPASATGSTGALVVDVDKSLDDSEMAVLIYSDTDQSHGAGNSGALLAVSQNNVSTSDPAIQVSHYGDGSGITVFKTNNLGVQEVGIGVLTVGSLNDSNRVLMGAWSDNGDMSWGTIPSTLLGVMNEGTNLSLAVFDQASDPTPFVVDASGNVGVGTATPEAELHVVGDIKVTGTIEGASPVNVIGGIYLQTGTLEVASGETRLNTITYSWPGSDGSNGDVLATDGSGTLSWTSGGSGDISAVGSMTSGEVFANASADGQWLGLGASAGRIEFNDQVTDEVNIMNARVGIGTTEPNALLVVHGGAISHDNANNLYGSNAATHVNLGIGSTTGVNGENNSYCTIGGGYNNMA
ncbi:MAG: hypothetical protein KJ732_08280, partial [Candidatus Margulisbacteria bacterium]|nr:hypothetical protein [Candidatus Margulisiibacteriota bacterium]